MLVVLLSACTDDSNVQDQINVLEMDLSGTWLLVNETHYYNTDTKDYLYSNYYESTLIFQDNGRTVSYNRCYDYGVHTGSVAIKSETHFYLNINENGFTPQEDGSFYFELPVENDPYRPNLDIVRATSLSLISTEVLLDNGLLSITGPISANEDSQVCINQQYNNISDGESYDILIPYDNDYLYVSISSTQKLEVGTYEFTDDFQSFPIYSFSITSLANTFQTNVGHYFVLPATATIVITEATENSYTGTFEFIYNENNYNGSFEINPIR